MHGWGKTPDDDWIPWLRSMLERRGIAVYAPLMPDTGSPHIGTWVPYLSQIVNKTDRSTYFIGHSMGCQAIIRYLEMLDDDSKAGGAVFVAGFFHLRDGTYKNNQDREIGEEWVTSPIDLDKVKGRMMRSTAIFSRDDPYVPVTDSEIFRRNLGSRVIIYPKRGHFTKESNTAELHVALNEVLNMIKESLVKDD